MKPNPSHCGRLFAHVTSYGTLAIVTDIRGVPRGVFRVLEHPHQIDESKLYLIEQLAREEATHTATDL